MNLHDTTNFKAIALTDETLRQEAPSIFALGPMSGVSPRYAFVPTVRIVAGLREHDWMPVAAEEQRIRNETRTFTRTSIADRPLAGRNPRGVRRNSSHRHRATESVRSNPSPKPK